MERCGWIKQDEQMLRYHDEEWGVPIHDDRLLFEALVLGGAQAGLSWRTILVRREGYRAAFARFDAKRVAQFSPADVEALLANPGIIRNRRKVESAIKNARATLAVREEIGTFDAYLWSHVEGNPVVNQWQSLAEIPARTPLSDAVSKDLRRRGFSFVGSTICYAFLQAAGLVNDHLVTCFRHTQLSGLDSRGRKRVK
ncbi:MAG: DNA-3-methyladenine glycosylase I [Isosphaeraceae bacterium]|nr:DNA-3-methyladenine glycosylase I [Isosphaeraceae bacterium]